MKKIFFALLVMGGSLFAERTIRIIGDSHAMTSFRNAGEESGVWLLNDQGTTFEVPYVICHLPGVTMYRAGRDGLLVFDKCRERLGVENGDVVVFVFGEIDVRYHIQRQSELQGVPKDLIIQKLVDNYLKAIVDYRSLYNDLEIVVFNVLPPRDRPRLPPYEHYGTLEQRITLTHCLNQVLREKAPPLGIKFLDVYSRYADKDGSLNLALSDGSVHISYRKNQPVKEALYELLKSSD